MNRIRVRLLAIAREGLREAPTLLELTAEAVNQILDVELAIMLESYREDLLVENRSAQRLATIGQFAASVGHELRNPLGVIESSLFLLRQHLGAETAGALPVAKYLDRIGGEVNRANKTIRDVLDLARNRPPSLQSSDLRGLVEAAAEAALLPSAVSVDVTMNPTDLTVDVDPDQLRQVFVNLFTNSAQAMPEGGRITVEGETLPSGDARLCVSDDGPGIPIEARYRVFEALFTTKAKGSGLGLALCRRILEVHGGSIDLDPAGVGATFLLVIPSRSPARGRALA